MGEVKRVGFIVLGSFFLANMALAAQAVPSLNESLKNNKSNVENKDVLAIDKAFLTKTGSSKNFNLHKLTVNCNASFEK